MTRSRGRRGRGPLALSAAAVALAAVLASALVTGCSPTAIERASGEAEEPARPLTVQEARRAFDAFSDNTDVARASGDERLALQYVTDGQAQLTAAAFRRAAYVGEPLPRYRYTSPRLFVPRTGTYPRWFVAAAKRTGDGQTRTAVLVFTRMEPGERWKVSLITLLDKGEKLPVPVIDRSGFASALRTDEQGLVLEPKMVGAMHATLAEDGPESQATRVMEPGKHTSDNAAKIEKSKERADDAGLAYDAIFSAPRQPSFALRTRDGGALVLYPLAFDTVVVAKSEDVDRVPVPQEVQHLLEKLILKEELDVIELYQYAAYNPPKGKGRARVLGAEGTVVKADGE
ncbi:MAG: hypothetical protein GEV11_10990 [Streptosporangiales bacterium]|nr:hypothetical protein [Streptosporangiales bacterium]